MILAYGGPKSAGADAAPVTDRTQQNRALSGSVECTGSCPDPEREKSRNESPARALRGIRPVLSWPWQSKEKCGPILIKEPGSLDLRSAPPAPRDAASQPVPACPASGTHLLHI